MAEVKFVKVIAVGPGWNKVLASDGEVYTFHGAYNWRSNNPGNIEYGPYAISMGAIGSGAVPPGRKNGFAIFPTFAEGQRAREVLQFERPSYRNKSIADAIARYAPEKENDTPAYVRAVTKALGVPSSTKMKDLTPRQREIFLATQARVEGFKPGKISAATGKTVPSTLVEQFKGIPLPALNVPVSGRAGILLQRAEQSLLRNRVDPPLPRPRPNPNAMLKTVEFTVRQPTISVSAGAKAGVSASARATVSPPAKPAVKGLNKSVDQIGREIDNGKLSGYRDIAAMGPSSKGAKPTIQPVAKKSGLIKTTAPEQEAIPRNVVPKSVLDAGYGKSPLTIAAGATAGLGAVGKVTGAIKTGAEGLAARQAKAKAAADRVQQLAADRQARIQQQAQQAAADAAARKAAANQAWARALATMTPAGQAAATPGISHNWAPVTAPGQRTDVFGNDMAFQPRSTQTSDRWNTGY